MNKNSILAVLVVGLAVASGFLISRTVNRVEVVPGKTLSIKERMMEGKPFNGGKPHPPVEISSNVSGEVPADQDVNLTIDLIPTKDCSAMKTHIRGLDGVIISGEADFIHPGCVPGQANQHSVTARAPAGVAGYAVIDYEFMAEGQVFQASKAIPIEARGAQHVRKSAGEVGQDENGHPIVIMKAQESKGKNVSE